jgi:acetolactate synthase-1/2/3 large subunit
LGQIVPALQDFFEEVSYPGISQDWKGYIENLRSTDYLIDETLISDEAGYPYLSPYAFLRSLFEELTENAVVIPDAGMNLTWTYQGNRVKSGQRIFSALGASPMGYALPAVVGAHYANKDAELICIVGDGGIQMNIQELQTIKFNHIPAKIFVMNNESLGNTKFPAVSMFGRSTGNDAAGGYSYPDFSAVGEAYGFETFVMNNDSDLVQTLRQILDSPNPCLIDVKINPEQFMLDTPLG